MPQNSASKSSSNYHEKVEKEENYWELEKNFKKKGKKYHLSELLYNFNPKSEFEKALLLGVLPDQN